MSLGRFAARCAADAFAIAGDQTLHRSDRKSAFAALQKSGWFKFAPPNIRAAAIPTRRAERTMFGLDSIQKQE
jgi:hypothetical protein